MTPLFPLWQVDSAEYQAICRYLGIAPNAILYDRISAYLASAPFRSPPLMGFARYLAHLRKTRLRIAFLDPVTKFLYPGHPFRHALNAVLSVHECNGESYRQMSRAPQGRIAILVIAGWGLRFVLRSLASGVWLAGQYLRYVFGRPFRAADTDLRGHCVMITGVSRGLGFDLMLECLARGASVIGIVRTPESAEAIRSTLPSMAPIRVVVADLAMPGALVEALSMEHAQARDLSMVIWCAGVKHDGKSVLSLPALRDSFDVNFFSAVEFAGWLYDVRSNANPTGNTSTTGPLRPHRAVRRHFVLISSIGRWHGMHRTGGYNASKAALSIWGESLEMELRLAADPNPDLTIVEPGMFASGMTEAVGLSRFLVISRREIACRIVSGSWAGKKSIRPPFWFAILTWVLCAMGRNFRYLLFSRAKPVQQIEPGKSDAA